MINFPKFFKSLGYAFEGIAALIKFENNTRIHLLATATVLIAGYISNITTYEWDWLAISIALVWICEAFNTAIEALVDLVSPDKHPIAKKVKDLSAAAVLLTCMGAGLIGVIIFIPHLW